LAGRLFGFVAQIADLRPIFASRHYTLLPATLTGDTLRWGMGSKRSEKIRFPFVIGHFSLVIWTTIAKILFPNS
jgi:hypothetical protein